MQVTKFFTAALTVCAVLSPIKITQAQTSNYYYAGQAVGGQSINVDLSSIFKTTSRSVDFVYYLGQERIQSKANCEAGTWTTLPEKIIHHPQSQATHNMLNVVCQKRASNFRVRTMIGRVFDLPSTVRNSPKGNILCSIRNSTNINIYGSTGSWYYTDVCGEMGVIHSKQVKIIE